MLTKIALPESGVSRPILAVLACIALLAVAIPALLVATTPRVVVHKPAKVVLATRVVPRTELPAVEAVELQKVAPTDAREINASIPFSTAPNPAARAFVINGAGDSQLRAIDCLAAAVYYEAGDDPVGQRAVAQVIINRMRHPAFPKTICGVVFQGQERSTGCQFTFTCDGAMTRYAPGAAAWQRARDVARMALNGSVDRVVGHATHYHTDWVVPYWSARLDKITEVKGTAGTHLFFRWTGWWGTPPAFRGGYTGLEPNVPRMARLSPVHIGGPEAPIALAAGVPVDGMAIDPAAIPESAVPPATPVDANSFLVTLPRGMSANDFASLAIRTCGERSYCKFMGWTDASKTPAQLPLNSTHVASMSFSYLRDERQGFAKALWNCGQFARPSPVQCMRAQPLARASAPPVEPAPVEADGKPAGPAGLSGVRRKADPEIPMPPGNPATRATMTLPVARPTPSATPSPVPTPAQ
jgi:spore germination cell wall hydrolase CwlJ-like protein